MGIWGWKGPLEMKSSSLSPGDVFILNYLLTNGGLSWAFQPLGKGTGPDAASGPGITSLEGSNSLILPKLPATFAHHPLHTHTAPGSNMGKPLTSCLSGPSLSVLLPGF